MGGIPATPTLLTDGERKAKLDALLGHRFTERGRLQLPTTAQYNELHTDEGLHALGIELCRWLGIKPNGLRIAYGSTATRQDYTVNTAAKLLTINEQYRNHPYTAAGILVFAVITYLFEQFDHVTPDRAMIEYTTLETGLGLWIINALRPRLSPYQRLYHILDTAWFHAEGLQLHNYEAHQYSERVASYAHDNRIASETYMPHILARCQYLLPDFITRQHIRYLPESNASILARKTAKRFWAKIILIAATIAAGIGLGLYTIASRPTVRSDTSAAGNNLRLLQASYESCLNEASKMQSTYDPNDLFLTRQVDAKKSECASLRNEYNFALDQYSGNN